MLHRTGLHKHKYTLVSYRFQRPFYPSELDLCIYLKSNVNISIWMWIFFPMYLLNGHFYGYSRSHKLYFEQTNTSCMTEQTTVTFFLFTNAIQFGQIVITAVQTSDFCFYRFDIIHDCSFLSLVSLYNVSSTYFYFLPLWQYHWTERKREKGGRSFFLTT